MRNKKILYLSFLLLANVVMLAHVAVLHHHNNQMLTALCHANQEQHCNESADKPHSHDTEDTSDCCALENCSLNAYTKADDFKLTKPVFPFLYNCDFFVNILASNPAIQIVDLEGLPFKLKPYLPHVYAEFSVQSFGLRAPPVC